MDLLIRQTVYDIMLAAARRVAPLEACGLLAGREGHATTCYELVNADGSSEHYSMRPEEQFAAAKDMRAKGQKLLAIWHSHPASPARMSDEDLRLAYTPGVVYVILSLVRPEAPDVRGFVLDEGVAKEVPVTVAEAHDGSARGAEAGPSDSRARA
ncbi:MAG: hypothetical protein A3K19_21065 [Lentisphaerae bacterium RIFOXYB12_FULL_65_16]|nr:MAG: hypothetical protein A3K18_16560 [Lentisphaerae bacterium RIFOXYA12_64_32]OGV84822.1 MAG: hypothetical protein A3K19_21065 [Lentisphaerae bacterium RIFOXYB12_FULL_65_16]